MHVWIIDDDKEMHDVIREGLSEEAYRRLSFSDFTDIFEAQESSAKHPDIIVIDLSSISPIMAGAHSCYAPICALIEMHPGAEIIINSGVPEDYSSEVADDVRRHIPDAIIHIAGPRCNNDVCGLLNALSTPGPGKETT